MKTTKTLAFIKGQFPQGVFINTEVQYTIEFAADGVTIINIYRGDYPFLISGQQIRAVMDWTSHENDYEPDENLDELSLLSVTIDDQKLFLATELNEYLCQLDGTQHYLLT